MTKRLRGRAAVEQRKRRIEAHPVCVHCEREGIVKATEEIDHIVPLSQGGLDSEDNIQGLCIYHHRIKSAGEDTSHEAASNHPTWLQPSAIPVIIVTGPPGSGKSSYVELHSEDWDLVIDLDAIALEINPHFAGVWSREILNRAIRQRNAELGALQFAEGRKAWFIVGAPTRRERAWWKEQLGELAELHHLDAPAETCLRRGADPEKVRTYFKAASRPWEPPRKRRKKVGIDADGYPID